MIEQLLRWATPKGHRYGAIEMHTICNRHCTHCGVNGGKKELGLTIIRKDLDFMHAERTCLVTFLGGEPISPFMTVDGIPAVEQTEKAIRYAKSLRMLVGVSTNADYLTEQILIKYKKAGLDWITESYHPPDNNQVVNKQYLDHLIKLGQIAANLEIVPMMHFLITNQNADSLPAVMAYVARQGIMINATIVQEKGPNFSVKPEVSLIPTLDQQVRVYQVLDWLRSAGLARVNRRLLLENAKWYPNKWKCNPEEDHFIHVGAGDTLDVCEEARTNISISDIKSLEDPRWREQKRELVKNCDGCLYRCYFESQKPYIRGDIPAGLVMGLIKIGGAKLVRRWGEFAAYRIQKQHPEIDWSLKLN